jgi:hypothetical protein
MYLSTQVLLMADEPTVHICIQFLEMLLSQLQLLSSSPLPVARS